MSVKILVNMVNYLFSNEVEFSEFKKKKPAAFTEPPTASNRIKKKKC